MKEFHSNAFAGMTFVGRKRNCHQVLSFFVVNIEPYRSMLLNGAVMFKEYGYIFEPILDNGFLLLLLL